MSVTELTVSSTIDISGRKVQVVAMLGRGAIGVSYLVRHEDGTQQVLKIFDVRYGEVFKQRLHQFRESRFTSSDSVVGYIDAGFVKDQPYIVHEYVQAKTFAETAKASKFEPKKPQAAIDLGVKLCQAVAAIHRHEIIHGHLWNGNVFFNVYGDPVIVDPFIGAPTPADVSSGIASPSQLSLFLAPEQKDINGFIDPRTDIWHIGALLCRLYTGKPDLAINELCLRELYKAKMPLSLIRVLWQAIQKSWHSRYPDVATFETALREAFEPEHRKTVYLKPLPYAPGPSDGWSRQVRNLSLGVGTVAALIAARFYFVDYNAGTTTVGGAAMSQLTPTPVPELNTPGATPTPTPVKHELAVIDTSEGEIHVKLFVDDAPNTVENFVGLATGEKNWTDPRTKRSVSGTPLYTGTIFHRVIPKFMIQGGDPLGTGTGGPGFRFDNEQNDFYFDQPGRVAMANAGLNTNGSQFFITLVPTPQLVGKHTIFGQVVKGMDVVKRISEKPTGRGNKPVTPVLIRGIDIRSSSEAGHF